MKINVDAISDESGNVISTKVEDWLKEINQETNAEDTQKIFKAIGFDNTKAMNAEVFGRRFMLVKIFLEIDKDKCGFLDIGEMKEFANIEDIDDSFKEIFSEFDLNKDGRIGVDEFLQAIEKMFSN